MPIRSYTSIFASFHNKRLYSYRICFPGSTASTSLICFLTSTNRLLLGASWDRTRLSVINYILGTRFYRRVSSYVAALIIFASGDLVVL